MTETERGNEAAFQRLFSRFTTALQSLKESGHYQWILLDLPHGAASLTSASTGNACQCPYSD